uniref:Uncharacterized protein n=1 Tax=viral metagenome TaxID=1070528 RepID=A0A6C0BR71_9ZZZZ
MGNNTSKPEIELRLWGHVDSPEVQVWERRHLHGPYAHWLCAHQPRIVYVPDTLTRQNGSLRRSGPLFNPGKSTGVWSGHQMGQGEARSRRAHANLDDYYYKVGQ